MNEPTTFQGLNDALVRRYGISGQGPVSTFASDAFPTIPVSDDQIDVASRFLALHRTCGARVAAGPPAGQLGSIGVRNPANSGVLVVVDSVIASSSAAVQHSFYYDRNNTITPSATASVVLLDARFGTQRSSALGVVDARVGGVSGVLTLSACFGELSVPARNMSNLILQPIVLPPNSQFFVESSDVAAGTMFGMIRWRERKLETWEQS